MKNKCSICGANLKDGISTISTDNDDTLIVMRKIPALICSNCGEEYFEDNILKEIEKKFSEKKDNTSQVQIFAFS